MLFLTTILDEIDGQAKDTKSAFGPRFSYLPTTSGYTVRNVHLSYTSMMEILNCVKLVQLGFEKSSKEAHAMFARIFYLDYGVLTNKGKNLDWQFSSFYTDGESVSVLFKKNVTPNKGITRKFC
jgi:hypothetical protein